MTIQQTSFCTFRLKFKSGEVTVNPTGKTKEGIALFSELNNSHLKYEVEEGVKLIVNAAGEYEANDIFIHGEKIKGGDQVIYTVSGENINIGVISFINSIESMPDDFFKDLDIILLNAGGGALYTPKQAENIYQKLSPKIAILFGFKEQASKERVDLFSLDEVKQDIEAMKELEKTFKITKEELDRIDNTEVHYFNLQ
jgi:hypothetical protein